MMNSPQIDRIAPTLKPNRSPIGYQSWRDLCFIHWRIDAEEIQALLPQSLSVDTFDGSAWIGLVPFAMRNVRPWWFPAVPGISHFLETNVRTYVHRDGQEPGVWFFSLDASQAIAVKIARRFWKLPYFYGDMSLQAAETRIDYRTERRWPAPVPTTSEVTIESDRPFKERDYRVADPGTLEHFLVERYFLYTTDSLSDPARGDLFRGQVHHDPYQFAEVQLVECHDELVSQAGFSLTDSPAHVAYSPGVDVDIHPLIAIED